MLHRILWAGALSTLAVSTPLAAQQRSVGPSFGITPYAGYMKFGNLVSGPLGTSVRNAGAAVYGAEATLGLTRAIALVGNVAYTQPGLDIGPASTHATNFAYNVGAGADVALAPRFGLQLMVKDYIGKFDAREATGLNVDTKTTHNFAVSAGLRLGL